MQSISWVHIFVVTTRGALLVQTIYIVSGESAMLVTLSTFNDYDFILRSFIRFDLMASLHDLMLLAFRALGDVIIVYSEMSWPGYAHFHRRKCKPSLYSPFPVVGGLLVLRTILTTGRRSAYAHSVHCNLSQILRNTPQMAIFGYFAKIVKIGVF